MPEVVRGSRPSVDMTRSRSGHSDQIPRRGVHFGPESPPVREEDEQPLDQIDSGLSGSRDRRKSAEQKRKLEKRPTDRLEDRPAADAYFDSRAATKREFKRRASTLQDYYKQHPQLLPQLPFTWKHGWRRWKLFALIFLMFVDACVIPIVLYYTMKFVGNVQGFIIFAVVATIWGGPTYLEFAIRSWRLFKKENFYRPLGTNSRWAFDFVHWIATFSIAAVTAFLIIGSAPHIVWLRILSLPGPALLLCLGGGILFPTIYCVLGRPAPFRISSTAKGEKPYPGVFYIVEDVVAVNANAGRPYREAIHARYVASPRFQKMMLKQSWFWSIPSLIIAVVLIVLICIHEVDKNVAYGIGWGIPFFWAAIWAVISGIWAKRDMVNERHRWEEDVGLEEKIAMPPSPEPDLRKEESAVPLEPEATKEESTNGTKAETPKEETEAETQPDLTQQESERRSKQEQAKDEAKPETQNKLQKEESNQGKGGGL